MIASSYRASFAGALIALAPPVATALAANSATLAESKPAFIKEGENMSAQRGPPPVSTANSSSVMRVAFTDALGSISKLRKSNRSTSIDCTKILDEFFRHRTTESYISFFRDIGFSEIKTIANQKHFVYWELSHRQLRSMGFDGFLRNDRLVIALTVDSASTNEVTSFKATLLNTDHL